jgi:hypothetical protein
MRRPAASWFANGFGTSAVSDMNTYYPRTTVVRALTRIRRERLLPQVGEIVVRVGQDVTPVQVVVRATQETGFHIVRAHELLGVPADEVEKHLVVQVGAAVQRGMPLLRKRGFWGRGKQVKAPFDSVLHQVTRGNLILQQAPDLIELRAILQGRVTSLVGGRGVAIETAGSLIQALWDNGQEGHGKIRTVVSSPMAPLAGSQLTPEVRGAILVAGHLNNVELLEQAEAMEARGVILGSMPAELCQTASRFSFPVFVTDGIGCQAMAEPIFELLRQSEEREASLLSRVSQRPGSRPEIIIPLPAAGAMAESLPNHAVPLAVGQTVRLLRAPYSSLTGTVEALCRQTRPAATGLRLPGADVKLSNGEVISVPYTNLDVIL